MYKTNAFNELLTEVSIYLPRDKNGNLIEEKSKSDIVHDLLACLAEQIIGLNRTKNKEIDGFLKWLEREVGCKIDDLIGKTFLKDYHEGDFLAILAILKRNHKKLSIDPTNRKTQEMLEKHFEESMSILNPLKDKIKATDKLIDQIVYKLYGLTDEEIEVLRGAGKENAKY